MSNPAFSVQYTFQDGQVFFAEWFNVNYAQLVAACNSLQEQLDNISFGASYPTFLDASAVQFGMSPLASPTANSSALQTAIAVVIAAGGGIIFIPAGVYQMSGVLNIQNVDSGIVILGSSQGTTLIQQSNGDMFDCQMVSAGALFGGVRFRDLTFQYAAGLTTGCAINCSNGGGPTTAEFCQFINCPQSFSCGADGRAEVCGILGCYIVQTKVNNSIQVLLSGAQCFVLQCVIQQTGVGSGGPTGCTGILINSGAECYVSNTHVSDFTIGVQIGEGARFVYLNNVGAQAWQYALLIQPTASQGTISAIYVYDCNLTIQGGSTLQTPAVYIDTSGGTNTNVNSIFFSGCAIWGGINGGLQVNAGTNIVVNGGQISGNGLNPSAANLGAGVVVSGPATNVTLNGVDLTGVFQFSPSGVQPYAISVFNGGNLSVTGCPMTGNGHNPPVLCSGQGKVSIRNCAGYNDMITLVSASIPANNSPTTIAALGYFGPATIYFAGGTVTQIRLGGSGPSGGVTLGSVGSPVIVPDANIQVEMTYSGGTTGNIVGS